MGNIYKSKAKRLKGDPYIGLCQSALVHLSASAYEWAIVRAMQQGIGDNASMLDASTKKLIGILSSDYKLLILAQGEDSEGGGN